MKKTYIVVASALMILFCLMYSVSYAYFSIKVTNNFNSGNKGNTVIGSDIVKDIILSNETKVTSQTLIPGDTVTSNFTVQNQNDVSICFGLVWTDVLNEFTRKQDLVFTLKEENSKTLLENVEFPSTNNQTIIEGLSLLARTAKKYILTVTYKSVNEDQTTDMNKKFHATIKGKVTECKKPKATEAITTLVSGANTSSTDVYTVPNKTSDSCTYTLAYDGTADNNLRYVGKNPCNYVTFNGEKAGWRIIGILNTPEGQRMKLIRTDSLGKYSWDNKASGTGSSKSSYGSNDWTDSTLKEVLNNGAYYNKTSGTCPSGQNGATTSCDFTSNGLTETAKNQIDMITWKLGGTASYTNSSNGLASHWYTYERGTTVYTGRPTEWQGKIGLMYPSDYGYATSGGTSMNRASCLAQALFQWNKVSDCKNNDWLYDLNTIQWTLAPRSSNSYDVFRASTSGYVNYHNSGYDQNVVRPSVYLKSSTTIVDGNGTLENPYRVAD